MASELQPCPFCGSNQLSFRSTPDMDTDGKFHRISCNECGASSRATFAMDACPLFYEELSKAWNTRPTPAATDTGLVNVGYGHYDDNGKSMGPVVSRSQAEELLAAERGRADRAEADAEKYREYAAEKSNQVAVFQQILPAVTSERDYWKSCATKAETIFEGERRMRRVAEKRLGQSEAELKEARDDNAAQAARIKELEAEHPEPLEATVKSLFDKAVALDADNTALTARVQTLEQVNAKLCDDMLDYELKIAERDVSLNELKQKLADKFSFTSDDDALAVLERYGHNETGNGIIKADMRALNDMCRAAVAYLCAEWDFVFQDEVELNRGALEAKLAATEKALEPFAEHANDRAVDDTGWRDKETVKIVVSIGDLRKARAVVGGKPS